MGLRRVNIPRSVWSGNLTFLVKSLEHLFSLNFLLRPDLSNFCCLGQIVKTILHIGSLVLKASDNRILFVLRILNSLLQLQRYWIKLCERL